METARRLENLIGGVWHGVSFLETVPDCPPDVVRAEAGRFCEAIVLARVHQVLVDPRRFTCAGANHAFGCNGDRRDEAVRDCIAKGYPADYVDRLIQETPRLDKPPAAIGVNLQDAPDVLLAALQPEQAMRLVQLYQKKLRKPLVVELSSVMSVCANVAVRAYRTGDAALSFGCQEARGFAGLSRDRLVAGLPYSLAQTLV